MHEDRMHDTTAVPAAVEDDHHGEILVELTGEQGETLVVSGERIPRVVLTRAPGAEIDDHIAIGTRDPRHLTLTVDGRKATIKPGRGGSAAAPTGSTSAARARPTGSCPTRSRAAG